MVALLYSTYTLANFRKMAATQAKIYAAGWGAMNDTVREERGLVQSTKL